MPKRQPFFDWIEANIGLPQDLSATPGSVRLFPYQRAIAEALIDLRVLPTGMRTAGVAPPL
jgi:hypothetical protein